MGDSERSVVQPAKPHQRLHSRGGTLGDGRAPEDQACCHQVVEALVGAQEILVLDPAQAELQRIRHTHAHDPSSTDKIMDVEAVDHPSDCQVVACARTFFRAADQMR